MNKIYSIGLLFIVLIALSFQSTQTNEDIKKWPVPVYPVIYQPDELSELGRALFYDPILSADSTISCASCHSIYHAFAHADHPLSHGINDKIGNRNAPALMNLSWQPIFMWDGAINHIDMQALAPISHPDEMASSLDILVQKLKRSSLYLSLFQKAYHETEITGKKTLKAIAQFMLTFNSYQSKYDSVKNGIAVFTSQEKKGYRLFKKYCNSCHQEPLFTNHQFEYNGLPLDTHLNDYGRVKISQNTHDSFKFKIPTLRNIEVSYPYMHDGRFKNLSAVFNHYIHLNRSNKNLPQQLKKSIILNSSERVELLSFLLTLTDKKFLSNPNLSYPHHIFH